MLKQINKLFVSVAVAIFVRSDDDRSALNKCAFYDNQDGLIHLPEISVTTTEHAPQVAARLIKTLIPIDPRLYTVLPIGFFDPIIDDVNLRSDREIILAYKVIVSPGMPISNELEWKDYEGLTIAITRVKPTHFRIYRSGLYS